MSDNDLIRRGDALECFMGLDRIGDIMDAITALPAVTVGVPCTWPSCGHTANGQCQGTGVRILAALTPQPVPDLSDPVVVHLNMLRGTIAKPTIEQIVHLYGSEALTAALPARGVTVKPLVWSQNSGGVWEAQTAFGTRYSVADSQWTYGPTMVWFWVDGGDEAAKAAAQADYEARILATLDLTPVPDAAAIREAAEASPNHAYRVGYAAGRAAALREAADLLFTVAGEKGATKTPQGRTAQYYARRILALIPREAECQAAGRCIAEGCPSEPRL